MNIKSSIFASTLIALAGCSTFSHDDLSLNADKNAPPIEKTAVEAKTMASLSEIEEAIKDYYSQEKKIPETLEVLVPKYLADIPMVELDLSAHNDTNRVTLYRPSVLKEGTIDGGQIKDTGGWGYVHNPWQIVVFIDCTHQSANGVPWYRRHTGE